MTSGRSDAHGRVVLHAKATATGNWTLHYFGDRAHFDSVNLPDQVAVR